VAKFVPFLGLFAWAAMTSAYDVAYVFDWVSPSSTLTQLAGISLGLALMSWAECDARRRDGLPCHEFAFLILIYITGSIIYYVFWSRGWRGVAMLIPLGGLVLLPNVVAIVAFYAGQFLPLPFSWLRTLAFG
jgi:hypothetical protein